MLINGKMHAFCLDCHDCIFSDQPSAFPFMDGAVHLYYLLMGRISSFYKKVHQICHKMGGSQLNYIILVGKASFHSNFMAWHILIPSGLYAYMPCSYRYIERWMVQAMRSQRIFYFVEEVFQLKNDLK